MHARLVGRGRHHAARSETADHHRLAPQARLGGLLDRGEERVHVQVQDRRRGSHTHRCCPHATDTADRTAPYGAERRVREAGSDRPGCGAAASSSAGLWPTRVSPVSTRSPCSCDSELSTSRQTTPPRCRRRPGRPGADRRPRRARCTRRRGAVAHQGHPASSRAPGRRCCDGGADVLQRDAGVEQPLDDLEHDHVAEAVQALGAGAVGGPDAGLDQAGARPVVQLAVGDAGRRTGRGSPVADLLGLAGRPRRRRRPMRQPAPGRAHAVADTGHRRRTVAGASHAALRPVASRRRAHVPRTSTRR